MQIERLPLTALTPAPYNPRITLRPGMPAYERLARSLREFDLVQPIVWNRTTGYVVGGHQRLEILRSQGVTEVDCVVVELSPERERALNVALNNERLAGDWDEVKLKELLIELDEHADFELALTGFDEKDLRDLLLEPSPEGLATDDDAGEAPPVVRVTLEIDPADWEAIRPSLDAWLQHEPAVRVHVRLP